MPTKIDTIRKISKHTSKLENLYLKAAKESDFDSEYNNVVALYDSDFDGIWFQVLLETLSEYCKEVVDTGLFAP